MMTENQKLFLELVNKARIVAGNDDITKQEKLDLRDLANRVEAIVIHEINASFKRP